MRAFGYDNSGKHLLIDGGTFAIDVSSDRTDHRYWVNLAFVGGYVSRPNPWKSFHTDNESMAQLDDLIDALTLAREKIKELKNERN